MQFDLLLSGERPGRNGTPWRSGEGDPTGAGSSSLGWGYTDGPTAVPHLLTPKISCPLP